MAERIFANRSPQVFSDVVTYTTLIRRSQNMREMEGSLRRIEQSGVTPDDVTLTTLNKRKKQSPQGSAPD